MNLNAQRERIQLFEKEIDGLEGWKREHNQAMECFRLEDSLKLGILIYDSLAAIDHYVRNEFLSGAIPFDPEYEDSIRTLFEYWLRPGQKLEKEISALKEIGFVVEGEDKFRKRYEEAKWMLLSASDAFDHEKMIDLRDRAVDSLRSGDVVAD
jgi:hypothetical protein